MPELTSGQYLTVYNMLSFAIACMFASFVYFVLVRKEVAPKYQTAITVSALVVFIAGYHYFRIFNSWGEAYRLDTDGTYVPTGIPFNDAYRYVDWILTVPLLMVELILVMGLTKAVTNRLLWTLSFMAFLMILFGYFGEIDKTDTSIFSDRGFWGLISSIPFAVILYVLVQEIRVAMTKTTPEVAVLLRNIGLMTLLVWGFYPIAYMAPFYGATGSTSEVFIQSGYSIADIIAKCGYGLLIHQIAKLRTLAEDPVRDSQYRDREVVTARA